MALGRKTGGRATGVPNKATADVRAAIALIAEGNVHAVESWIMAIEDPAKRVDCFLRMLEYHIPKLGRTEHTGPDGGDLHISINDPTRRLTAP